MKYFNMEREEIRNVVYSLGYLCDKMDKLDDDVLNADFKEPKHVDVRKLAIEDVFQSELSKLIDLNLLPDDILFPILDNIDSRLEDYYADEIKDAYNTGFGDGEMKQKHGGI